jgi:hypothetical protein
MTIHSTTSHIQLTLLTVGDVDCSVPSTFRHEPSDPYAVRLGMRIDGCLVEWLMSRELLHEGLHRVAGIGDVCVHPGFDEDGAAIVHVELSSPEGDAVLLVPARELEQFLNDSYRSVPAGSEIEHLDIDAALAQLFADC